MSDPEILAPPLTEPDFMQDVPQQEEAVVPQNILQHEEAVVPSGPSDWINNSLDQHPGDHPASWFLGKEFLLWLWWKSETAYGAIEVAPMGAIEFWIDDRIQFGTEGDQPQLSDLKGGQPTATAEARSALRAGKTVETANVGVRIGEREYTLALKGETLELAGLKVPGEVKDGLDERIYERMFLLDEITAILDVLFFRFTEERLDQDFRTKTLQPIREWIAKD